MSDRTAVTAEDVRAAAIAARIDRVDHHDCSICGYMTAFLIWDGDLYFDRGCDCTSQDRPPEPRPWGDAADWINMQTSEVVRSRLMLAFGISPRPAPP